MPAVFSSRSVAFSSFLRAFILCAMLAPSAGWTVNEPEIVDRLEAAVRNAPNHTTVTLYVERADNGSRVFAHRADYPMIPASNMKLITTASALYNLGADFRYDTELLYCGTIDGETLDGDLVVVGVGDPSFSGRFSDDPDDVTGVFRNWARVMKDRGITTITGDVIGDDDAFDDEVVAPGWPEDQLLRTYCAEVSALTLNDGCVDIIWRAGGLGSKPTYELNPDTSHLKFINTLRTRNASNCSRWYQPQDTPYTFKVIGNIAPGRTRRDCISVDGATLFFASVLKNTLEDEGLKVQGKPRDIDEFKDKDILRDGLHNMARHISPPLSDIVHETNLHSQNLFAELLLKTQGAAMGKVGSFETGAAAIHRFFTRENIPEKNVRIVDGSGLSRGNRVTAQTLVGVLRAVDRSTFREAFFNSLPVGGESGSLKRRFYIDGHRPSQARNIHAKTGYIRNVRSLTGWAITPDGTEYRFSILVNAEPRAGSTLRWIDSTALGLVKPTSPPLKEAVPHKIPYDGTQDVEQTEQETSLALPGLEVTPTREGAATDD